MSSSYLFNNDPDYIRRNPLLLPIPHLGPHLGLPSGRCDHFGRLINFLDSLLGGHGVRKEEAEERHVGHRRHAHRGQQRRRLRVLRQSPQSLSHSQPPVARGRRVTSGVESPARQFAN
eukprot:859479-Prorocentrum_minimum.AAC.1